MTHGNQTHTCKNCGFHFMGEFCSRCGEKMYSEHDKSISHLFEEVFHFFTHFDGTFLTTVKAMFTRPGKFSLDYCNGIRKKYFKPLSFFLLLVILYLLFPVFKGLNMKLEYHHRQWLYGDYALAETKRVEKENHYTPEEMEEAFHHKSEKVSKFLLFIILPFMAAVSYGLGFKKRKYYFDNFIFSTEVSSFFILFGFLLFPFAVTVLHFFGIQFQMSEGVAGSVIFIVVGIYIAIAARRFFGFRYFYSIFYSLIFLFALAEFLEMVYKGILFFIAIHLV